MKTNYSILITGDLVVDKTYEESKIDEKVINLFNQADLNVINLEAPITNSNSKIIKTGPHLKADQESTSKVLKALNVDIVTLANNHILDYDEQGLRDTLIFCKENKIKTVGAGMSLEEASRTIFVDTNEGNIAFINFTENEWTCATENTAGANPMDLINNFKQIRDAKKKADFVLVIVHGGNEYNHYPSPRMVKQYRFYAESGADAVIGHHTHCIGGYETYNGIPIIYSLGNFLFARQKPQPDVWYKGLVLKITVQKDKKIDFQVIPVVQEKEDYSLTFLEGQGKKEVLSQINDINLAIQNPSLLLEKWEEFVLSKEKGYVRTITPIAGIRNKYVKAAFFRLKLDKVFMNQLFLKETLNRIRCEAHYDVTKEVLKRHLK